MSNSLAIAAVTTTLRNLLSRGLGGALESGVVTTRPPDKARENGDPNQLNLFLYHVLPDPAWRNRELPNQVRSGESGHPPLPLKLYYLVTAYGRENDDTLGHRLLGRAMQVLHDSTILNPADIRTALPDSDLQNQIDSIRITFQPNTIEEISRLWSSFQTQYRISATYEVSVVLIESKRPSRTPLPVLTRGRNDEGVLVQAGLIPPFPTLETLELRGKQPSVYLGTPADGQPDVVLQGHHLDGQSVRVLFQHPRLPQPLEPGQILLSNPATIQVQLPQPGSPDDPAAPTNQWLAGFYQIKAMISPAVVPPAAAPSDQTTNELAVPLAPRIVSGSVAIRRDAPANGDPYGRVTIALRCQPSVLRSQPVSLLLGDREIAWVPPDVVDPSSRNPDKLRFSDLRFEARRIPPGDYWMRLRVDGVDSQIIINHTTQPSFDPNQRVTLP